MHMGARQLEVKLPATPWVPAGQSPTPFPASALCSLKRAPQPRPPKDVGPRGQTNHTAKGFEFTQPFLENLGENGNLKKKNIFKRKTGRKKLLLLMSFIISIESFLPLMNASWWPVCGRESETQRPTQASTRHAHDSHSFSDTHRSACWLSQTLLLLPAEIDLKNKQF